MSHITRIIRSIDPSGSVHALELVSEVEIKMGLGTDAITRVTGPNGDEWREQFYDLHTERDVLGMWADNALRNGVTDASRLEGWGDLEPGVATMRVTG